MTYSPRSERNITGKCKQSGNVNKTIAKCNMLQTLKKKKVHTDEAQILQPKS